MATAGSKWEPARRSAVARRFEWSRSARVRPSCGESASLGERKPCHSDRCTVCPWCLEAESAREGLTSWEYSRAMLTRSNMPLQVLSALEDP